MTDTVVQNNQLILVGGESGTGKSASLQNIPNQNRWFYLNSESGKKLPFRNTFQEYVITDPYQTYEAFQYAETNPNEVDGIIIDTLTFLMDMMESQYVIGSTNTQKAWGDFAQFFKVLMQQYVARSPQAVIILAHTRADYDETAMEQKVSVPVKGSLKNNGIEAYFSTVVATKKVPLTKLENYKSDLLHISEEDELLGYKHVFQTRLTKETINERIRSPMGLFTKEQTYTDNDAALLLEHLKSYYS